MADSSEWPGDNHPVIELVINGDARALPLGIMTSHEIVNTTAGGRAVAITYYPLCNSASVFDRTILGHAVEFGVSGILRNSDLVMSDRSTETRWQQLTGEAIVGGLVGMRLQSLPASVVPWAQFKAAFPDGLILSRQQGSALFYDNPYTDYDSGGLVVRLLAHHRRASAHLHAESAGRSDIPGRSNDVGLEYFRDSTTGSASRQPTHPHCAWDAPLVRLGRLLLQDGIAERLIGAGPYESARGMASRF